MNCKRMGLLAASAMTALAVSPSAFADDLPTVIQGSAQAGTIVDSNGGGAAVPAGQIASGSWSADNGLSTASASVSGSPFVLITASGSAMTGGSASAYASISYFVTVAGGSGYTGYVPIDFTANLTTTGYVSYPPAGYDGQPYALADASFSLGGNILTVGPNSFESRYCSTACLFGNFSGGGTLVSGGDGPQANPSLTYAISGLAQMGVGDVAVITESVSITSLVGSYFTGQTSSASASADPYFFIDPEFALEHPDITLVISPGVENNTVGGGVPEPVSWALMVVGFGGLGAVLRRRRGLSIA